MDAELSVLRRKHEAARIGAVSMYGFGQVFACGSSVALLAITIAVADRLAAIAEEVRSPVCAPSSQYSLVELRVLP